MLQALLVLALALLLALLALVALRQTLLRNFAGMSLSLNTLALGPLGRQCTHRMRGGGCRRYRRRRSQAHAPLRLLARGCSLALPNPLHLSGGTRLALLRGQLVLTRDQRLERGTAPFAQRLQAGTDHKTLFAVGLIARELTLQHRSAGRDFGACEWRCVG